MPASRFPYPRWILATAVLLLAEVLVAQTGPAAASPVPASEAKQNRLSRQQAEELFRSVDEILRFVSRDTGLPVRHSIKKRLVDRAYVYQAARARSKVVGVMVRDFIDRVFEGAAKPLVVHLVEDRRLSPKDLEAIRRLLREKS